MNRTILALTVVLFLTGANGPKPAPPIRGEYLANLEDVSRKLIDLAESIPADRYTWRPAPDVRSVSEVFTHIAGSNYFLLTFVGKTPPPDLPVEIEKITEKQRVIAELKKSLDNLHASAEGMNEAELERAVRMFGSNTTGRGVYTTILTHLHEHLGQSIAYARINGVTPPWSR